MQNIIKRFRDSLKSSSFRTKIPNNDSNEIIILPKNEIIDEISSIYTENQDTTSTQVEDYSNIDIKSA
jgi:hypothetical protein